MEPAMPTSPDLLWLTIALIVGFLLGLIPAVMLARRRAEASRAAGRQELATELAALQERLAGRDAAAQRLEQALAGREQELDELAQLRTELERDKARLAAELREQSKSAAEKLQLLDDAKQALQSQFENLANQIFDEKARVFADQSRVSLTSVLSPFKEKITEFEKRVADAYSTEGKERHSLIREVQRLQQLNQQISQDADNLTRALKGDTKTQGSWGEVVLERILEESGLRRGSEYDAQGGFRDEDGHLLKPDVIVHLPEGKEIIIDSKVSLVAYERYVRSEDDTARERAIKDHLASINAHLKGLESKKYDELPGVTSLDFVLMFIPIESAFMLAIDKDNEIFRKAFDRNIMIVSPSTLLVTLRTIENIWRYEHQNKNALEIADRAGKLYEKFVAFVEDLEKVGSQLESTRRTYDAAHNKLVSGRGNLVSRANGLIDLGVKSRKQLPGSVAQQAEIGLSPTDADEIDPDN
jgi:DNA recombination protein RmuC